MGSGLNARVGILGDGVPSVYMLMRFVPPHVRVSSPLHGVLHSLPSVKFAVSWITPSHPDMNVNIIYSITTMQIGTYSIPAKNEVKKRPLLSRASDAHLSKLDACKSIRKSKTRTELNTAGRSHSSVVDKLLGLESSIKETVGSCWRSETISVAVDAE